MVAKRLRAFRSAMPATRAGFAVLVGIGTERLASYESARVPIQYSVFRAITQAFHLSPFWLATGTSAVRLDQPFDDSAFLSEVPPRATFLEIYDRFLADPFTQKQVEALEAFNRLTASMRGLQAFLSDLRKARLSLDDLDPSFADKLRNLDVMLMQQVGQMAAEDALLARVNRRIKKKC